MKEIHSVGDHTSSLPSILLVLDVVVPVAIIIIIVVKRELLGWHTVLSLSTDLNLDFVDARLIELKEVCHALIGSWLDLVVIDTHLLLGHLAHILKSVVLVKHEQCLLHWSELLLAIIDHALLDDGLDVSFVIFSTSTSFEVLRLRTKPLLVELVELELVEHLLTLLHGYLDLCACGSLRDDIHHGLLNWSQEAAGHVESLLLLPNGVMRLVVLHAHHHVTDDWIVSSP